MPTLTVTDAQLKKIEKCARVATRGPWFVWKDHPNVYAGEAVENTPGRLRGKYKGVCDCDTDCGLSESQIKRNAAYIASVDPDTVAALVAEVLDLRARVAGK